MIISFCGHSIIYNPQLVYEEITKILDKLKNYDLIFYLGGYGNFDNIALHCANDFKNKYNKGIIYFITPYLDDRYIKTKTTNLTYSYDEILYPDLENTPLKYAISKRNLWMIKQADLIIAYVKNTRGNSAKTLNYAIKQNKKILNIAKFKI